MASIPKWKARKHLQNTHHTQAGSPRTLTQVKQTGQAMRVPDIQKTSVTTTMVHSLWYLGEGAAKRVSPCIEHLGLMPSNKMK